MENLHFTKVITKVYNSMAVYIFICNNDILNFRFVFTSTLR